jgi:hypothetical protein
MPRALQDISRLARWMDLPTLFWGRTWRVAHRAGTLRQGASDWLHGRSGVKTGSFVDLNDHPHNSELRPRSLVPVS